jgi:hypothetical protein
MKNLELDPKARDERQRNENRGEKRILGFLESGEKVFDRHNTHINIHPDVKKVLKDALLMIDSQGRDFLNETVDFGEVVGETSCVSITPEDSIVYAKRKERKGPTKFVMNREPEPTSKVTVILKKNFQDYVLITAWIGDRAEPELWDRQLINNPQAREKAETFWNNHAMIYNPSMIDFEEE